MRGPASCPSFARGAALAWLAGVVVVALAAPARAQLARPLPSPLGLEDVLTHARAHRDEIAAARANARAAAQRPAIVSSLEDPMISPSLDHLPFMLHGVDASLTVEQRFPLSGVRGHRQRAAEAEARGLRADAERVVRDVELDSVGAFLMLHERRQMVPVLDEQLGLARQFVAAAGARYAAGGGNQADVLRAEIEVARLEGAVRANAAEVAGAEAMLNASLGRPADGTVPPLRSIDATSEPAPWGHVREVAARRRPELETARAEISRAVAEVSVMDAMYSPMGMVRTGPAYTMSDGWGWMVMVGVSVPLWRDRLAAGVSEAEAMAEMARSHLRAMSRMVEGEAAASRNRVLAARARFLSLRDDVVPRARRVIEPALAGYAAGQAPLVSVIEAAQALWAAQAELVWASQDLGLAWARLHRALGGFPETSR